jgi:hypothetical protein
MLTIPEIASSFGALTDGRDEVANEKSSRNKGEFDGGCRGTNLAPEFAQQELA